MFSFVGRKKRNRLKRQKRLEGKTIVTLLPLEASPMGPMQENGVSTITFLEGSSEKAFSILQSRLKAMVHANPWLAGSLGRLENGSTVLLYDEKQRLEDRDIPEQLIKYYDDKDISSRINRSKSYTDIDAAAQSLDILVKKGIDAVESKNVFEPILKVSIIPDTKKGFFSIIFSLSHVAGDGCTFYMVYNMLMQLNAPIKSMDPERRMEVPKAIENAMGGVTFGTLKAPVIVNFMYGMIKSKIFGMKQHNDVYYIDEDFIEQQKKHFVENNKDNSVPFLSTNDIVTSTILQATKCELGMMAVNFRGRVDGLKRDEDHNTDGSLVAGNYEECILYRPADFSNPSLIRKSVMSFQPASKPPTKRIKSVPDLLGKHMSLITNWVSFAENIDLGEDFKQSLHMPLPGPVSQCSTLCSFILFRADGPGGKLALTAVTKKETMKAIKESGLIKRQLILE